MDSATMMATVRLGPHWRRFWKSASTPTERYTGLPLLQGPVPALSEAQRSRQGDRGGGEGSVTVPLLAKDCCIIVHERVVQDFHAS